MTPTRRSSRGFAAVQFGNVVMYRKAAHKVLFSHSLVGLGVGIGILFLIFWGDWRLVLLASVVHVVSYLLLNSAVNAVGHTFGRRPFVGAAANTQWLAWLTAGEGLHSNHHAAPTSARLFMHRREMDPGWWVINTARRLRWLTVRHQEPKIAAKARRTPEMV